MFPHQYPTTFFAHNSIFQTYVVLGVEIQNGKHENLWFETQ
jgi:hypothetical protein